MTSKEEAKALIEAAVTAAIEASMRELDEKLQAAVNLGVTIGAAAGADVGAKAAVKAVERERKAYRKKQYDWKYQNTKLLLRNYRRLNAYYENAIFSIEDAEEADESFEDIMRNMGRPADEEIFVESIQKNYLATRIIMTHVNKCWTATKSCARGRTGRTTKGTGGCWRGFTSPKTTPRRSKSPSRSTSTRGRSTRILTCVRRI